MACQGSQQLISLNIQQNSNQMHSRYKYMYRKYINALTLFGETDLQLCHSKKVICEFTQS